MNEIEYLSDMAIHYDSWIIKNMPNFYDDYWNENLDQYELFKNNLIFNLKYIDCGTCCSVYRFNNFVLKLHTPYNNKMDLLSNPTKDNDLGIDELARESFLFYDFISKNGYAAVQKFVDCSVEAKNKASSILGKVNTLSNFGMNGEVPVIIDWF